MKVAKSLGTKVMDQVISPTKEDTLEKVKDLPRRRKLVIKGLQKSFGGKVVYDGFDLELELGTFTSVFGPNGCGKSTLINMISGLMPRDGGSVLYDGRTIEETSISYVFQNYREALFPWRRAIDNIRYPMDRHGYSKKERESRIDQLIEDFGIRIDLNAYPYMLSGGQQQAVSILRALAIEPDVLFLDEPFSALDYEMTLLMREKLQSIFEKNKNDDDSCFARSRRGSANGR